MSGEGTARESDSSVAKTSWRVEPEYFDARGTRQHISPDTIATLERALETGHAGPPRRATVLRAGAAQPIRTGASGDWQLLQAHQVIASGRTDRNEVELPHVVPSGSYRMVLDGNPASEWLVLAAPHEAWQPPYFRDGGRAWLLAVQLYSIRSARNWGHGDFTDLAHLLKLAAKIGAAGIGVNPLHALAPGQSSPYSPTSRLFLNPLYVDLEAIPEAGNHGMAEFAADVEKLRAAEFVDYAGVHAVKSKALRLAYASFLSATRAERRRSFESFCARGGDALKSFCAFQHLHHRFGGGWQSWPAEWRNVSGALEKLDPDELEFHAFVQWTAHEQLAACRKLAENLGLPVGLYLDIAVGVDAGGADAWANPEAVSDRLSIGAPPDIYNPAGQNWGLAAPNPQALIDTDFGVYRRALDASMQYAGAIRIDHALGLNRLYLIPSDTPATKGAYVSYPFDVMLAMVAQESVKHRCLVIGEDLGTVPEGVSETLNQWGVWSYRIALFEREHDGRFRQPEHFPHRAIVTFNTHDLPTFAGWAQSHDLQTKRALSLDPGETDDERASALSAMHDTLNRHSLPPLSFVSVARYLARTRSQLLAVGIEDIIGIKEQPNIPGTIDEHPNWRRKLPISLDEFASSENLHRVAKALEEEGRGFSRHQSI